MSLNDREVSLLIVDSIFRTEEGAIISTKFVVENSLKAIFLKRIVRKKKE